MAAQLLGDRLDLAGRDALHVHLGQGRHQRLLGTLVTLEQLGREPPVAVLRHPQLELADPGDEGAVVSVVRTFGTIHGVDLRSVGLVLD